MASAAQMWKMGIPSRVHREDPGGDGTAPDSPSMEALLGRMVMAPTATSSRLRIGEILDPQLSEPTHRKWPVRLAWRVASRTLLVGASSGY